jgi:hypothetical protein
MVQCKPGPKEVLAAGYAVVLVFLFLFNSAFAAPMANIEVTQTRSYSTITGNINYFIDWKVTGNGALQGIVIADEIPAGTTFVTAGSGYNMSGNFVSWILGDKNAGERGRLTLEVSVDAAKSMDPWASSVVSFKPGLRNDGSALLSTSTGAILGKDDNTPVPLGLGGSIIVEFDFPAENATGSDVTIFRTGGSGSPESADIFGGNNLQDWVYLGTLSGSGSVDFLALPSVRYVKVTDVTAKTSGPTEGFKLDAVTFLHLVPASCDLQNSVTATGVSESEQVRSISTVVTDIHSGCSTAYSGSSIHPGAGGGSSSPPGGSGPSTGGSGGSAPALLPAPSPSSGGGSNPPTPVPESPANGVTIPEGRGGGEVLGGVTKLPRTGGGMEIALLIIVFVALFAYVPSEKVSPKR